MFGAGKLLAEVFERLRQPAVIGEIVAGVLLGPAALALVHPTDLPGGLAEMGASFRLFTVGLETAPRALLRVGGTAALAAALGVIAPLALGFAYMKLIHRGPIESLFVAAAMVATSVGITARVLGDLGVLETRAARVILAAAVIDDILGMIVLAVVSSLSAGRINYWQLVVASAEAIAFALFVLFFGSRLVASLRPTVARLQARNSAFALSVLLCLGLSLASVRIGMAAIIGAVLAGLALADHSERWRLAENAHPVMEFLAPFFFVLLGAQMDPGVLRRPGVLTIARVISLLAIASKLLGCGLGALRLGPRDALRVGLGMVPRGEVGLIVAAVGLRLHTISPSIYAVVIIMCMATTLFAPPLLRLALRSSPAPPSPVG